MIHCFLRHVVDASSPKRWGMGVSKRRGDVEGRKSDLFASLVGYLVSMIYPLYYRITWGIPRRLAPFYSFFCCSIALCSLLFLWALNYYLSFARCQNINCLYANWYWKCE